MEGTQSLPSAANMKKVATMSTASSRSGTLSQIWWSQTLAKAHLLTSQTRHLYSLPIPASRKYSYLVATVAIFASGTSRLDNSLRNFSSMASTPMTNTLWTTLRVEDSLTMARLSSSAQEPAPWVSLHVTGASPTTRQLELNSSSPWTMWSMHRISTMRLKMARSPSCVGTAWFLMNASHHPHW